MFRELTNSAIYFKALKNNGIDTEFLNLNYLSKEIITKAREILGNLNVLVEKSEELYNKINNLTYLQDDNIYKDQDEEKENAEDNDLDKSRKEEEDLNKKLKNDYMNEMLKVRQNIFELSSRYYELIPKTCYRKTVNQI